MDISCVYLTRADHPYAGKYYLFGTRSETCWGEAYGFDCYISYDLETWEGPKEIFHRPQSFFATNSFWAPECYLQNGAFYLMTTFGGEGIKKGIYLLKSDSPDGSYSLYGKRLTPEDWNCIDGTLYTQNGRHYLIYSHSFEDAPDADICVQELADDLTHTISTPKTLFAAKEAPWAKPVPFAKEGFGLEGDVYFSDGPCLFRLEDDRLYMTWSSWSKGSYAVGVCVSESGTVEGPWIQQQEPLWPENGGHGMVFTSFTGDRYFLFHYPNDKGSEHPCLKKLINAHGLLQLE